MLAVTAKGAGTKPCVQFTFGFPVVAFVNTGTLVAGKSPTGFLSTKPEIAFNTNSSSA